MKYLIRDPESRYWWRADSKGYTSQIAFAGVYEEKEAKGIERCGRGDKAIPLIDRMEAIEFDLKCVREELIALEELRKIALEEEIKK